MQKFSYEISDGVYDLFDELYNKLSGHKYRIIEAAIEVFAALPKEHQRALVSQDDADRKVILDHLKKLNPKSARDKTA